MASSVLGRTYAGRAYARLCASQNAVRDEDRMVYLQQAVESLLQHAENLEGRLSELERVLHE